jgi:hypothetical protein
MAGKSESAAVGTSIKGPPELALSLVLDKKSYRLADDIVRMRISFMNVSDTPMTLYTDMGWGPSSSLSLIIADAKGQGLQGEVLSDARDYPPFRADDFKTLLPGQSWGFRRLLSLQNEGIKEPGVYKLIVAYHCRVRREFVPEGLYNAWTEEKGSLSRAITFSVTK